MCVSVQFDREDGSGSGFGSWKTVPAVPVPRSVPGKTVPTVPVRFLGHSVRQKKTKKSPSLKSGRAQIDELVLKLSSGQFWERGSGGLQSTGVSRE